MADTPQPTTALSEITEKIRQFIPMLHFVPVFFRPQNVFSLNLSCIFKNDKNAIEKDKWADLRGIKHISFNSALVRLSNPVSRHTDKGKTSSSDY